MITWDGGKAARALSLTAQKAFDEAKSGCPVRTGRLKNSIALKISGNTAEVSANTWYAVFVELGTGRTSPRPFMQNALAAAAKAAPEIYLSEIFGAERNRQL